jgi:hypothetical protein
MELQRNIGITKDKNLMTKLDIVTLLCDLFEVVNVCTKR